MMALLVGLLALDACPEARTARWSGDAPAAEMAARACVERAPTDADALLELSRALSLSGRRDEALVWADRAVEVAPSAPDPRVWRARLSFWAGHLDRARADLAPVLESFDSPEAWELAGRIALADGDADRAEILFTTALGLAPSEPAQVGRAAARTRLGRPSRAFSDLDVVCRSSDCAEHWRWWRNLAPVAVHARSEVTTGLAGGGALLDSVARGTFGAPFGLRLGPIAAVRARTDVDPDVALGGILGQSLGRRLDLEVQGRFGLGSGTLPSIDVRGRLVVSGLGPLWLTLGGRYLDFEEDSAAIAEPTLCGDAGRWGGCGRYSAVVPESQGVRHFGLLQGWFALSKRWGLRGGAGGGNTNDFMLVRKAEAAWSIVGYGGVEHLFSRRHALSLTYTFRHEEQLDDAPRNLNQVSLAYDLRLGW